MKRRSSLPLVGVLAVSVLGAGVTRSMVLGQRARLDEARHATATAKADLSKVNSFALGLLLGGLRGPLVMALWTSSENQKTERDLEDFDTKVELIRLLQPEFDTVHLFQIWNKAYNVSVQMANVPNKYTTILDALQYAFDVDKERPDNINILAAIGGLYFDKFGGSAEKAYFSSRLMSETMAPENRVRVEFDAGKSAAVVRQARLAGASTFQLGTFEANDGGTRLYMSLPEPIADALRKQLNDPAVTFQKRPIDPHERRDSAGHPTQHATLLDQSGDVLKSFTSPAPGGTNTPDGGSGAAMPYLPRFEPYRYGVSPYALAFNYYKRCQWLQTYRDAKHAQLSDRVISSRCPMALEKWNEEEWYNALRAEIDLAGRPQPADEGELNSVTPDLVLDAGLPDCPLFDQAIYRFERASSLAGQTADEYAAHLKTYPDDILTYQSHIYDMQARGRLNAADALYLRAMRASGDERRALARQAAADYQAAANLYTRYLFRYFVDDDDAKKALPQDVRNLKRADVENPQDVRDDELAPSLAKLRAAQIASGYQLANSTDFREIDSYVLRCYARLRNLAIAQ